MNCEFKRIVPASNKKDDSKFSFLEQRAREAMQGTLDSVRVGKLEIEPWKIKSLFLEMHDFVFVDEVLDITERDILLNEALAATQDIMLAYFARSMSHGAHKNFAGLCERGSAIMQELLARAGVRTVQVFGTYHAQNTERHVKDIENIFQENGDYGHYWICESGTGVVPTSTQHALKDLVIVDPTRKQFDLRKPYVVHPREGSYTIDPISKNKNASFYTTNQWLWNTEELKQWAAILNSL